MYVWKIIKCSKNYFGSVPVALEPEPKLPFTAPALRLHQIILISTYSGSTTLICLNRCRTGTRFFVCMQNIMSWTPVRGNCDTKISFYQAEQCAVGESRGRAAPSLRGLHHQPAPRHCHRLQVSLGSYLWRCPGSVFDILLLDPDSFG